jgi:16S rRNA pseudouridine516 synthase
MTYQKKDDFMMRLDKMLSNLKYGSRSEIKNYARQSRITVNGETIKDSDISIDPLKDQVMIDSELVFYRESIYLMMNKPMGVICASVDDMYKPYTTLIDAPFNRFDLNVCGRLDVDSEGLIVLTNDGEFLHKVISPKHDIYKTYYVTLRDPLSSYQSLEKGVMIKDGAERPYLTKPAKIFDVSKNTCRISISEGKFHQVKRMFEFIGNEVKNLKREKIGLLDLDKALLPGDYRELTAIELELILKNE